MPSFPPGFDPNSDDWSAGDYSDEIADLANAMGWQNWGDAVYPDDPFAITDPDSGIRPRSYATPQEALANIIERGIESFAMIYWDGEDWRIVVDY